MKTKIAVGTTLLLTIGSAVAGTMMYGQGRAETASVVAPIAQQPPAAEMVRTWKVAAMPADYIAPRAPI
jgi:UPF0716 family protein affecting phage T7 exclusion